MSANTQVWVTIIYQSFLQVKWFCKNWLVRLAAQTHKCFSLRQRRTLACSRDVLRLLPVSSHSVLRLRCEGSRFDKVNVFYCFVRDILNRSRPCFWVLRVRPWGRGRPLVKLVPLPWFTNASYPSLLCVFSASVSTVKENRKTTEGEDRRSIVNQLWSDSRLGGAQQAARRAVLPTGSPARPEGWLTTGT